MSTCTRAVELVVDDLRVPEVGVGPLVGHVLVHRLALRSRHHRERPVRRRRRGDREPHAHLVVGLEREVERVLVPRLAARARVLEDELREEAVDVGAEEITEQRAELLVAR